MNSHTEVKKYSNELSLIILTYNSEKDIYHCLDSVYEHNDIGDALEIIVVDNNSRDFADLQRKIAAQYTGVKIISNANNGGYGQGNNIGIKAATAPIIAIMNPDVRLIMPVFKRIVTKLSDNDTIMCGGKQYIAENKPAISFSYDHHACSLRQSIGNIIRRKYDRYDYRHMWLSGAFFAIKKHAFEEIGLFDERIFMYGEEFDIHLRIRKLMPSKKIAYLPDLKYIHLIEERAVTKESISKQLRSDMLVCQSHNISPKRSIRSKIIAQYILYYLTKVYGIITGISYQTKTFRITISALKEMYSQSHN